MLEEKIASIENSFQSLIKAMDTLEIAQGYTNAKKYTQIFELTAQMSEIFVQIKNEIQDTAKSAPIQNDENI